MADPAEVSGVVAISGHRDGYARSELFRGLNRISAREYVFGGARGVDTDALEYIGRTQPGAVRTVIVPNEVRHQPAAARAAITQWADEVIELRNTGPGRYQTRNIAMIDRADRLHAFYDFRGRGGTRNAIEYAKATEKAYSVVPVGQFDVGLSPYAGIEEIEAYARHLESLHVTRSAAKGLLFGMLSRSGLVVSRAMIALFRAWKW